MAQAGENDTGAAAPAFAERRFSARDGLMLAARDYGADDFSTRGRLPVICLPGLTRNARDFHQIALLLSRHPKTPRRVLAFDYRGRGRSAWDKDKDKDKANYNLVTESEDVMAGAVALGIERAAFIGTSRGALIIHMLAGLRPAMIAAAILNDAGPVIEGAGLAQIKSYLERIPRPKDWHHARALLRDAHGASFPALGERDWAEMAEAIYVERDGRIVADHDPALVRQLAGIDFNTRLPTLWPQFDGLRNIPLMVVRGVHSQLLSEDTVSAMSKRRPDLVVERAEGQGHAPLLHLGALPGKIAAFLVKADRAA